MTVVIIVKEITRSMRIKCVYTVMKHPSQVTIVYLSCGSGAANLIISKGLVFIFCSILFQTCIIDSITSREN